MGQRVHRRGAHSRTPLAGASSIRGVFGGKDVAFALVFGLVASLSLFGKGILEQVQEETGAFDVIPLLAAMVGLAALCLLLFKLFDSDRFGRAASRLGDRVFVARPANVAALTVVILLAWLPVVALMYPFHIGPDTIAQLLWWEGYPVFDPSSREFIPGATMSDHHPVFDTVIYGAFYDAGKALGNPAWGMTALCWLQTIAMAAVFAYGCCWMRKRGVPAALCFLALAFWSLNPTFPMLLEEVVKDITSMPFFVLWFFGFVDLVLIVRDRAPVSLPRALLMGALTLLCSLTRKTLLYITVPSLAIVFVYALVKAKKKPKEGGKMAPAARSVLVRIAAMGGVTVLVMMVVLPKIVFPALGIISGGVQETIAVPIQQISRVVTVAGDDLSSDDREAISAVLPYEELPSLYDPAIADPVKDSWNRDATTGDAVRFLATWAELGFKYPGEYLKAAQYLYDYLFVGSYGNDIPVVWWGWEDRGGADLFPGYAGSVRTDGQEVLDHAVREVAWQGSLFGKYFFDIAVYALWAPLFSLLYCLRRNPLGAAMLLPVALSFAILFLVPASQPRYAFNFVFLCPAILGIGFAVKCGVESRVGFREAGLDPLPESASRKAN